MKKRTKIDTANLVLILDMKPLWSVGFETARWKVKIVYGQSVILWFVLVKDQTLALYPFSLSFLMPLARLEVSLSLRFSVLFIVIRHFHSICSVSPLISV